MSLLPEFLKQGQGDCLKFQESQGCPEKPCVVGVGGECSNNQEAHSSTLDAKVRS